MEPRSGVRSSARLSGAAGSGGGGGGGGAAPAGGGRTRALEAAEAARRRARAAERAREVEDSPGELRAKCRRLARALRDAKHLVVYTGAGISTAADIPDYRGPHGVWTRLQRGETVGRVEVSAARPTFTHMALTALWARGTLKFVVSQNCDGLHVRAGLPRRALAELHGDMFCELCAPCRRVYLRAFDTTERTARHAHGTRRLCHACGAELRDSIVHFGERGRAAWPLNWAGALRHAARADVVLCLGSSLKVLRRYPRLWRMHAPPRRRPALYIVNLQWTPKDAHAALKINARCDAVMRQVARRLRLRVPRYSPRADPLLAHAEPLAPPEAHTTRRPLLPAPAPPSPPSPPSPSCSDSDEELPLRHLAERLRAPSTPPDRLRAFQVNMRSGEATILLRVDHAPSPPPPPAPPPPRPPSPPPGARLASDLRRFRMPRPASMPLVNGHVGRHDSPDIKFDGKPERFDGKFERFDGKAERVDVKSERFEAKPDRSEVKSERNDLKPERFDVKSEKLEEVDDKPPKLEKEEDGAGEERESWALGSRLRRLLEAPRATAATGAAAAAGALAAAYFARAVLVCRASLYPGLHTILAGAGAAAPPPPAECGWCLRRHGARRCLWYGPPRLTPLSARAARRRGVVRLLCACCDARPSPAAAAAPSPPADDDGGGWYGKGYRKGRRRR